MSSSSQSRQNRTNVSIPSRSIEAFWFDSVWLPPGDKADDERSSEYCPSGRVQDSDGDLLNRGIVAYLSLNDGVYRVQHGGSSDSEQILQILADEYAREILLATNNRPKTAKTLSEECDASLTTIYR